MFIWGAGKFGKEYLCHCKDNKVDGFIDNSSAVYGTYIQNIKVYSYGEYI